MTRFPVTDGCNTGSLAVLTARLISFHYNLHAHSVASLTETRDNESFTRGESVCVVSDALNIFVSIILFYSLSQIGFSIYASSYF
jgi:hypothetical protein